MVLESSLGDPISESHQGENTVKKGVMFLGQLVSLSLLISVGVKYGGSLLRLPATTPVMVILIASPACIVGLILWGLQSRQDPAG